MLGWGLSAGSVVHVAVIALASGAIWVGSGWLEGAAERLSGYYGLPAVVQGSIVVAVGSSFPEFASVVVTALAGVFDMGVGAVVGSAIFNVLVVPALSGLGTDDDLESSRAIVHKEAQFYMLAVSVLVITFALAVIYDPVPGGTELVGRITRPLAAVPLLTYGLYLFIQWQDVSEYEPETGDGGDGIRREWLTLATVLLFGTLRTGLALTDAESYVLLGAYLIFVLWVIAETVGVTRVLPAG